MRDRFAEISIQNRFGGISRVLRYGLILAALVAFLFSLSPVALIPAGHRGVVFNRITGVQPSILHEGLNFRIPLVQQVIPVDVRAQKHEGTYDAASKDLQAVRVHAILNYRLVADRVNEVYQKIGLDYARKILDPATQEVIKANTALHNAGEILAKRPLIKDEIKQDLTRWLKAYNIELLEVSLADIRFSQEYERAIEQKQVAEQRAEQKRYELLQAQRQAEIEVAQAEGHARALRVKADAEAYYNEKVTRSLTPLLVQQRFLEKWEGKLPQIMGGNNLVPFIGLPLPGQGR